MHRGSSRALIALLMLSLALSSSTPGAHGQAVTCLPGGNHTPIQLGTPDASGITREDKVAAPDEKHGFYFTVPKESSGLVYVGDQWYDLDLFLYFRGACPPGSWEELARAWSVRAERRSLQFVRPDEQIIQVMRPGEYLLIVGHKYAQLPEFARDFNPERGFTIRIALNAMICAVEPPDENVPNPLVPTVMMPKRPDSALYQLALSMDPPNPGPFSLMTFTALVSPPYSDLFDFGWEIDGVPVPDSNRTVIQLPSAALAKTPGPDHKITAFAKGVRTYPDPDQPHIPLDGGILGVSCTVKVGTT